MCRSNEESVHHLFVSFSFTRHVWTCLEKTLNISLEWDGNSIEDCLPGLLSHHSFLITLPVTVCWSLWLERNKKIFHKGYMILTVVAQKSLLLYKTSKVLQVKKRTALTRQPPKLQGIVGWFDGAAMGNSLSSGANGVI
jgi:hypothetical protein